MVKVETDKGDMTVELYDRDMPNTVANFKKLVGRGFYDGLIFHRVEDWVIQTGDPTGTGTGGSGETIKLETSPQCTHVKGAVGMARSSAPDSASSQWYIVKREAHFLDGQYACFGRVVEGMEVAEKIQKGDRVKKVTLLTSETQ